MDIAQLYMASPDWLKFTFILAPCLTLVSIFGIWTWRDVRLKTIALASNQAGPLLLETKRLTAEGRKPLLLPPDRIG